MKFTTHKSTIVGCGCSRCVSGMHRYHRNKRARRYAEQPMAVRKIRRTWKQLGKLITRFSRGYTD